MHTTRIESRPDAVVYDASRYRATCSCGWVTRWSDNWFDADEYANGHVDSFWAKGEDAIRAGDVYVGTEAGNVSAAYIIGCLLALLPGTLVAFVLGALAGAASGVA